MSVSFLFILPGNPTLLWDVPTKKWFPNFCQKISNQKIPLLTHQNYYVPLIFPTSGQQAAKIPL